MAATSHADAYLLFRKMKELIENGHVYIATRPCSS